MRLWRWLCCLTGHHRETVREVAHWFPDDSTGLPGCFVLVRSIDVVCPDCGRESRLYHGTVGTPSRRYALRPKQGRAA